MADLESLCGRKSTVGSNPTLSAKRNSMKIEKKVWPEYFQKIIDGVKKYELRLDVINNLRKPNVE